MHIFILFLSFLAAYLIGSVNFSIVLTKMLKNSDIRTVGSGNAGFTNALRTQRKQIALITFAGDVLKGVFVIAFGFWFLNAFLNNESIIFKTIYMQGIGFSCVIGHIFPCFFDFRGGKGILTAGTVITMLDWREGIVIISIFLIILIFKKIISLASVSAAMIYPLMILLFYFMNLNNYEFFIINFAFALGIAAICVFSHRENIKRLLKGEEKPISMCKT